MKGLPEAGLLGDQRGSCSLVSGAGEGRVASGWGERQCRDPRSCLAESPARGARQVARRRPAATVRERFWSLFLHGLEPGSEFREGEAYPAKATVPGVS